MSVLELCDVVKHFHSEGETVRAIDGASLSLTGGEFVALYGPSGSGKTTLLMLAAGLIEPDEGRVLFDRRDLTDFSPKRKAEYLRENVGIVFQSFHLMAGASALTNAAIKLMMGGGISAGEARRRARPWLDRVGLAGRHDYRPRHLSMGERQRVAIARALVGEPGLLLTDEPTGNLDSERSRDILRLLSEICHERAIPGLIVTHDPLAIDHVDRIYTLQDGKLHDGLSAELSLR
ncbi:MAG TPA: ABC transporter ATP-binding protein [Solirubrobacteraceae bacterium]|nr:ABC transporter ATP-binding protein [Solirubrobacteraceae bacterium]